MQKDVKPSVYLGPLLPAGWQRLFKVHMGCYPGLKVVCPVCQTVPPPACDYGLRRWRWLAVHLAEKHGG
jgi:hypothetical protein